MDWSGVQSPLGPSWGGTTRSRRGDILPGLPWTTSSEGPRHPGFLYPTLREVEVNSTFSTPSPCLGVQLQGRVPSRTRGSLSSTVGRPGTPRPDGVSTPLPPLPALDVVLEHLRGLLLEGVKDAQLPPEDVPSGPQCHLHPVPEEGPTVPSPPRPLLPDVGRPGYGTRPAGGAVLSSSGLPRFDLHWELHRVSGDGPCGRRVGLPRLPDRTSDLKETSGGSRDPGGTGMRRTDDPRCAPGAVVGRLGVPPRPSGADSRRCRASGVPHRALHPRVPSATTRDLHPPDPSAVTPPTPSLSVYSSGFPSVWTVLLGERVGVGVTVRDSDETPSTTWGRGRVGRVDI